MCGIVGFTGPTDTKLIRKMNDVQVHRGPDSEGFAEFPHEGVSLAARRLQIIDIERGEQPMVSARGRSTIVFNGEVFNSPDLRKQLLSLGVPFNSGHSDTEVVVNIYDENGPAGVTQLNGMFAFVVFDHEKRRLFGARDRFGIKPLYYSTAGGRFAFASELKSLLTLPWIHKELDPQAVFHYLSFQSVPAPLSIFQGIHKLEPGQSFIYDTQSHRLDTSYYWVPSIAQLDNAPVVDPSVTLRVALDRAVSRWSTSDVGVVSSLSGGIDSALVTALHAVSTAKTDTFTLGFSGNQDFDERRYARLVATKYANEHHEIEIGPGDVLNELDQMVWHLDEPYGGGLPSWFIFKSMGAKSKVALTGVGGDELFGNYGKWVAFESWRARVKLATGRLRMSRNRWPIGSRYHPLIFGDSGKRQALQPGILSGVEQASEEMIEALWDPTHNPRNAITLVDLRQQLPNEFLAMVDRFSMAHSVEARTPFLDNEFVDMVLTLPSHQRSAEGDHKATLKRAALELIPDAVLTQPKRGFVLPLGAWVRNEFRHLAETHLAPKVLEQQGIFRSTLWDSLIMPTLHSDASDPSRLWTLLMFQLWHKRFLD